MRGREERSVRARVEKRRLTVHRPIPQVEAVRAMFEARLSRHPRYEGLDAYQASNELRTRFILPAIQGSTVQLSELDVAQKTYAAMCRYAESTSNPLALPRTDGQLDSMIAVIRDLGGEPETAPDYSSLLEAFRDWGEE